MTYCLLLKAQDGLVHISDSLTNAGTDNVSAYRKMFCWQRPGERALVLMCAGNLSTSRAVVHQLEQLWQQGDPTCPLLCSFSMQEMANQIGALAVYHRDQAVAGGADPVAAACSLILSGQIVGNSEGASAYLIYPQGNNIPVSEASPWLHLGEIQGAAPVLQLLFRPWMHLREASQVALMTMDALRRSALLVGPPINLMTYRNDSLNLPQNAPLSLDESELLTIRHNWEPHISHLLTTTGQLSVIEDMTQTPLFTNAFDVQTSSGQNSDDHW